MANWPLHTTLNTELNEQGRAETLLMFSTRLQGFTQNISMMSVPIDDHGFHRGDGVFEAVRGIAHRPYLLSEHLDRLFRSSQMIELELPLSKAELIEMIHQGFKQMPSMDSMLRIYATRGPGSYGVSPQESSGAQIYAVWTKFKPMPAAMYIQGARLGISEVPMKNSFFPQVKSLNYLANVLMKSEALKKKM